MIMLNWLKCKTLRDLNTEALKQTQVDLAYARLTLGRAQMDVQLLEARERCLLQQAAAFTADASAPTSESLQFPTLEVVK
jgi:hypothetical protein